MAAPSCPHIQGSSLYVSTWRPHRGSRATAGAAARKPDGKRSRRGLRPGEPRETTTATVSDPSRPRNQSAHPSPQASPPLTFGSHTVSEGSVGVDVWCPGIVAGVACRTDSNRGPVVKRTVEVDRARLVIPVATKVIVSAKLCADRVADGGKQRPIEGGSERRRGRKDGGACIRRGRREPKRHATQAVQSLRGKSAVASAGRRVSPAAAAHCEYAGTGARIDASTKPCYAPRCSSLNLGDRARPPASACRTCSESSVAASDVTGGRRRDPRRRASCRRMGRRRSVAGTHGRGAPETRAVRAPSPRTRPPREQSSRARLHYRSSRRPSPQRRAARDPSPL